MSLINIIAFYSNIVAIYLLLEKSSLNLNWFIVANKKEKKNSDRFIFEFG